MCNAIVVEGFFGEGDVFFGRKNSSSSLESWLSLQVCFLGDRLDLIKKIHSPVFPVLVT